MSSSKRQYKLKIVWENTYAADANQEYEISSEERYRLLSATADKALTITTLANGDIKIFDPRQIKRLFITEVQERTDISPKVEKVETATLPEKINSPEDIPADRKVALAPVTPFQARAMLDSAQKLLDKGMPTETVSTLESKIFISEVKKHEPVRWAYIYVEACTKVGKLTEARKALDDIKSSYEVRHNVKTVSLENNLRSAENTRTNTTELGAK